MGFTSNPAVAAGPSHVDHPRYGREIGLLSATSPSGESISPLCALRVAARLTSGNCELFKARCRSSVSPTKIELAPRTSVAVKRARSSVTPLYDTEDVARPSCRRLIANPRSQLIQIERLAKVVAGTRVQPLDSIRDLVEGRQQEDRNPVAFGAQGRQQVKSGSIWKHDVQHNRIERVYRLRPVRPRSSQPRPGWHHGAQGRL